MVHSLKVAALAVGAFAFIGTAGTASAVSKCAGSKIKAVGKKASCKLGLESKEAGKAEAADPLKVAACESKFSLAIGKADTKGPDCSTSGDAASLEAKIDAFVDDVDTEISGAADPPATASKCQASKIKAAGKKAKCKLGLRAKVASKGDPLDPIKEAGCESKFSAAFSKAELAGDCGAAVGDTAVIEAKVDAFVDDVADELPSTPAPACCAAAHIETTSSAGTLEVATIPAFPFPANVVTIIEVGAAGPDCKHTGIVPAGGFSVPPFCIPALGFTSDVLPSGCEAGGADGAAVVWDAASTAPDPDVNTVGDTSDPDGNSCGTLGTGCNTAAGGAGNDNVGNNNKTRGGAPHAGGAVHTQVDIPVNSITWVDADGDCPDLDGVFDPGTDTPVTNFDFILSPTTGNSSATFTDLNGDSCAKAGAGPVSKSGSGSPATGPCCVVGQATTVAATSPSFTGGAPLYDITFKSITPTTISNCSAPSSGQTCTLTTDPCLD